jgi:hypothetical protein
VPRAPALKEDEVMREISKTVYRINELSEKAQEKAYYDWCCHDCYPWASENEKSLKEFEKYFPVEIRGWEYDEWNHHVKWSFTGEEEIEELEGFRLAKYLYNNYFRVLYKGKYYSLWSKRDTNPHYREGGHAPKGKLKYRYSKVMFEKTCTLTGFHMDWSLLEPIWSFIDKPVPGVTFYDLMEDCLYKWGKDCSEDFRANTSMEAFIETSEINDWEYYEDGSFYR